MCGIKSRTRKPHTVKTHQQPLLSFCVFPQKTKVDSWLSFCHETGLAKGTQPLFLVLAVVVVITCHPKAGDFWISLQYTKERSPRHPQEKEDLTHCSWLMQVFPPPATKRFSGSEVDIRRWRIALSDGRTMAFAERERKNV